MNEGPISYLSLNVTLLSFIFDLFKSTLDYINVLVFNDPRKRAIETSCGEKREDISHQHFLRHVSYLFQDKSWHLSHT